MWHRRMAWIDPVEAAQRLADLPALAWLDSARPDARLGRYSYLAADPFARFVVRDGIAFWNGERCALAPLAALREKLASYRVEALAGLPPFQGGAIGAVAYEFGWALEGRVPPRPRITDDLVLGFYDVVLAFDHMTREAVLIGSGWPQTEPAARAAHAQARLDAFAARLAAPPRPAPAVPATAVAWRWAQTRAAFCEGVERVKDYIRDGDVYQANLAQRLVARMPEGLDAFGLYLRLRAANPAPFGAFLDCGDRAILSTSPESFLRSDGRHVETRPIKGTVRRPADAVADAAAAARLSASRKDRAENVMIVDLLRNDLARVCEATSVEVPALCRIESYAGLHHLVSSVTGVLRRDADVLDLLAASFPGGSITGAPKLRAMEIIAEIEGESRGIYCGAIGAFGFDGSLDLNIAIRTLIAEGDALDLRVGGGITLLSDAEAEYEETLVKAQRLVDALTPNRRLADALA